MTVAAVLGGASGTLVSLTHLITFRSYPGEYSLDDVGSVAIARQSTNRLNQKSPNWHNRLSIDPAGSLPIGATGNPPISLTGHEQRVFSMSTARPTISDNLEIDHLNSSHTGRLGRSDVLSAPAYRVTIEEFVLIIFRRDRVEDQHHPAQTDSVIENLRSFFSSALPGDVPAIDDDYFALGHANSLFALELVTFVERHFSITVEVTDLELNNFRTIARTAEFVRRKLAVSPSSPGYPSGAGHV
ncbi:MAG: acyl carrier protein [Pseudonocardiaceae bacterium]